MHREGCKVSAVYWRGVWLETNEPSVLLPLGFGAERGVWVSGMGFIGWDKARGPQCLCHELEWATPRSWITLRLWRVSTRTAELTHGLWTHKLGRFPDFRNLLR